SRDWSSDVCSSDLPFHRMVPAVHEGPDAIYSMNAYPGDQPAWIFRRAKDVQAIYLDTEHFSAKDFAPFSKLLGDTWSVLPVETDPPIDRKSTRLNSSHVKISYAVFC